MSRVHHLTMRSGNHESIGPPLAVANFEDDMEDLNAVARYLVYELGYQISIVVGHSRGKLVITINASSAGYQV